MGDSDSSAETDGGMVLAGRGLVKTYREGDTEQRVLDGLDIEVERGHFVCVMGPSGSGKSTLLHLLGGLDVPDAGEVVLEGRALSSLSDDERTKLRRHRIGVVYQFFNLIPVLTAEENVALPAVIAGQSPSSYRDRLDQVLELVGLTAHRTKQPSQLSGGEQQRAAIARALFIEPAVLLADEPTGNLDMRTGAEVLEVFVDAQESRGQTVVMVTHDPRTAAFADEVLLLREGRLASRLSLADPAGPAARLDRRDEARSAVVLRWLEDQRATGAVRRRSRA